MSEFELKRDFDIAPLEDSAVTAEDVVAMWIREGALAEDEARRRADEILLVGTTPDGGLAGVYTAYIARSPELAMDMWFLRGYVLPAYRASNLGLNMLFTAQARLGEGFRGRREPRAPGIVLEVESPGVERAFPQAVWPVSNFAFFGIKGNGAHLRVYWFEGARAPVSPNAGI